MFQKLSNLFSKSDTYQTFGRFLELQYEFFNNVNPQQIISAYTSCSPVYDATNRITESILDIPLALKTVDKQEFTYNHPIFEILNNPNPYQDGESFKEEIFNTFLIFNNLFLHISGEGKPLEIFVLRPEHITFQCGSNGYPERIDYNGNNISRQYVFQKKNGVYGFFDDKFGELVHLRGYNPNSAMSHGYIGLSRLAPLQIEILQYILLNSHNHALLKNQGRPSGIMTYKGSPLELDDGMVNRLQREVNDMLSGSENAGKMALLTGDFHFQQLSESIKDMDFPQLSKRLRENVYTAYHIPLPFVSNDRTTMSNLSESQIMYYRDAVFPPLNRVVKFLMHHILHKRYKNTKGNLILSFDETSVAVIRDQLIKDTDKISKANVLTPNELRSRVGYEAIENGDTLMVPLNMQPLGNDMYTSDERVKPTKDTKQYDESYIRDVLGRYNYSEKEIQEYLKRCLV